MDRIMRDEFTFRWQVSFSEAQNNAFYGFQRRWNGPTQRIGWKFTKYFLERMVWGGTYPL